MNVVTETKVIRNVIDSDYWDLPVGTPIIGRRGKGGTPLLNLVVQKRRKSDYKGSTPHKGSDGKRYHILPDPDDANNWVATSDDGDFWEGAIESPTEEGVYRALNDMLEAKKPKVAKPAQSNRQRADAAMGKGKVDKDNFSMKPESVNVASDNVPDGEFDKFSDNGKRITIGKYNGKWWSNHTDGRAGSASGLRQSTRWHDSQADAERRVDLVVPGARKPAVAAPKAPEPAASTPVSGLRNGSNVLDRGFEEADMTWETFAATLSNRDLIDAETAIQSDEYNADIDPGDVDDIYKAIRTEANARKNKTRAEVADVNAREINTTTMKDSAPGQEVTVTVPNDGGKTHHVFTKREDGRWYKGTADSKGVTEKEFLQAFNTVKKNRKATAKFGGAPGPFENGATLPKTPEPLGSEPLDKYTDAQLRDGLMNMRGERARLQRDHQLVPANTEKMIGQYQEELAKRQKDWADSRTNLTDVPGGPWKEKGRNGALVIGKRDQRTQSYVVVNTNTGDYETYDTLKDAQTIIQRGDPKLGQNVKTPATLTKPNLNQEATDFVSANAGKKFKRVKSGVEQPGTWTPIAVNRGGQGEYVTMRDEDMNVTVDIPVSELKPATPSKIKDGGSLSNIYFDNVKSPTDFSVRSKGNDYKVDVSGNFVKITHDGTTFVERRNGSTDADTVAAVKEGIAKHKAKKESTVILPDQPIPASAPKGVRDLEAAGNDTTKRRAVIQSWGDAQYDEVTAWANTNLSHSHPVNKGVTEARTLFGDRKAAAAQARADLEFNNRYKTDGMSAMQIGKLKAHLAKTTKYDGKVMTNAELYDLPEWVSKRPAVVGGSRGGSKDTHLLTNAQGQSIDIPKLVHDSIKVQAVEQNEPRPVRLRISDGFMLAMSDRSLHMGRTRADVAKKDKAWDEWLDGANTTMLRGLLRSLQGVSRNRRSLPGERAMAGLRINQINDRLN